ncbi:hypothetical protein GO003_024770 [Methylicorpusculum oleiharenae]|uniref:hypothetical protein n=1 Tax=Methylicorpusculum oleiharenae TaxID=1338687 RepID=UPI00135950C2|nr:hypothetical protein [Methylicorpusculum oleiharenae]MCD2453596.1 hypothetical protein [Methylicorpusculum oleiharenae]
MKLSVCYVCLGFILVTVVQEVSSETQTSRYPKTEERDLTIKASSGFKVDKWGGEISGQAGNGNQQVTGSANFPYGTYSLEGNNQGKPGKLIESIKIGNDDDTISKSINCTEDKKKCQSSESFLGGHYKKTDSIQYGGAQSFKIGEKIRDDSTDRSNFDTAKNNNPHPNNRIIQPVSSNTHCEAYKLSALGLEGKHETCNVPLNISADEAKLCEQDPTSCKKPSGTSSSDTEVSYAKNAVSDKLKDSGLKAESEISWRRENKCYPSCEEHDEEKSRQFEDLSSERPGGMSVDKGMYRTQEDEMGIGVSLKFKKNHQGHNLDIIPLDVSVVSPGTKKVITPQDDALNELNRIKSLENKRPSGTKPGGAMDEFDYEKDFLAQKRRQAQEKKYEDQRINVKNEVDDLKSDRQTKLQIKLNALQQKIDQGDLGEGKAAHAIFDKQAQQNENSLERVREVNTSASMSSGNYGEDDGSDAISALGNAALGIVTNISSQQAAKRPKQTSNHYSNVATNNQQESNKNNRRKETAWGPGHNR